jgi:hypothetical protein
MTFKTGLLAVALTGIGVFTAAAQTGNPGAAGDRSSISPATHCIDRATNQPRLRTAGQGSGTSGNVGAEAGGGAAGRSAMDGASGMGSSAQTGSGMGGSAAGVSGADLQRC